MRGMDDLISNPPNGCEVRDLDSGRLIAKGAAMKEQTGQGVSPWIISPCPFCQASAEMRNTGAEDNADYIECTGCGASTNLQYSIKEDGRGQLIERWNNRVELGAAWNELMCCDDIRLDQGMAVAVGDLQKHRENLSAQNAALRDLAVSIINMSDALDADNCNNPSDHQVCLASFQEEVYEKAKSALEGR
jgi:Zn ribbon nucleic-acid-binding protein